MVHYHLTLATVLPVRECRSGGHSQISLAGMPTRGGSTSGALFALRLCSKAPTEKITLSRKGHSADITDAARLEQFAFAYGPGPCLGTESCPPVTVSWIVDWIRGTIANPDLSLPRYDVTYH